MRHGTTCWNEKGITQGRLNNRLSKSGIKLTNEVAERLKDKQIDVIVASPLMRTMQTANIINKFHHAKIIKDESLIEIDQGIFTGRNYKTLSERERAIKRSRDKSTGMETYEECYDRMKGFLKTFKRKYPYENILIVTHNCCASFIADILENKKVNFGEADFVKRFKNAEVKEFVF